MPVLKQLLFLIFMGSVWIPGWSKNLSFIRSYTRSGDTLMFHMDTGSLELVFRAPDIVEVRYSILSTFPAKKSLVFLPVSEPSVPFTVRESQGKFDIRTSRLDIRVDRSTGAIRYLRPDGRIILAEDGSQGKTMNPARVTGFSTYTCSTQFLSPASEALYGLGCHPLDSGSVNYKGRNQTLEIRYMTGAIPVLLSTRGYGLIWDNYSVSHFFGRLEGNTRFRYSSESGSMVDYYFIYGPDFDHIIARYREATGKAPMFPKWAFGLFQSQDRYQSQAEFLAVKNGYRNNRIPVDALVQDWFYWTPAPIGSHTMNPLRYPDPKAMIDSLHLAHIHAMISIWPCFGSGSADYEALERIHGLTRIHWDNFATHHQDAYYDPFNPAARALYWQQARDSLIGRDGWDGWWADQCEPDDGDSLDLRRENKFFLGRGIDYFNAYSLMHTTAIYQGWRRDIPAKRVFILARQAFAGQQRNAATLWSSDITCTFHSLADQVTQGINACASGIPYWTSDIGGYHLNWTAPDWSLPQFRELFIRWFEFGAFCPIFRIHGKGERALFSSNWDPGTKAILLHYDQLRYRLMPYIYSLGWMVTHHGYTPLRSLAFDFRKDPKVENIGHQYMFGPDFLVSPVVKPERVSRILYLPRGISWYDFWTGIRYPGGKFIRASAPLNILPLYIRAGSILPMGPYLQYATEKPADPLELRIYSGSDGHFTLYEDANNGYGYERGQYATITINWRDSSRILTLSARKGNFPGILTQRTIRVVLVRAGHGVGLAPAVLADRTLRYRGARMKVSL